MIISGIEIEKNIGKGIVIEPFNKQQINPNSYNLRLHNELVVYDSTTLDMKKDNPNSIITITNEGFTLRPGKLHLGRTVEYTETHNHVPMLEGRSLVGRVLDS
jgi:dCTP deaminase